MKKTIFTRAMAFCLTVVMLCGSFAISASAATVSDTTSLTGEELKELLNASPYSAYDAKYADVERGSAEVVLGAEDLAYYTSGSTVYYYDKAASTFYTMEDGARVDVTAGSDIAVKFDTYDGVHALYSPSSGALAWNVTIPKTGRYAIEMEYHPLGDTTSSVERMFYIDGKIPFAQARYLTMSKSWAYTTYEGTAHGFRTDINGNELKPTAEMVGGWRTYQFSDPDGFFNGAFEFYFNNDGAENVSHTITLQASRETMAIKSIRIYPAEDMKSYSEVLASYKAAGYQTAGTGASLKIEAERPYRVSDTSVFAANDRTSAVTSPSSAGESWLNVLGSTSYNTVGQWASYRFTVDKSGLYTISIRNKQDALAGMYTSRTLRLAGGIYGEELAVPFAEAYNCRFNYDKAWKIDTLGDGTNVFQFYFEEGVTYTMSLDVSLGTLAATIEDVEASLNVINNCYLEILKLTGTEPDTYRDYKFSRVMPATIRNLLKENLRLTQTSEELTRLCGTKGAHVATLDKVALLLKTMGSEEDKIAENLTNLKSYIGTLGTWLNSSKQQSLMMDYIVVSGTSSTSYSPTVKADLDGNLYKVDANFFEAFSYEVTSFFKSFLIDYNSMGVTNEVETNTSVEVWLATGRDQASIWRNLIDSTFTSTDAGRGIAVDLKLVAGGSLLPSVLAQQGPDLYMGLDSGSTINYAIRSAVLSVTDFIDKPDENGNTYRDTVLYNDFNDATLIPLTMYDQIYGLPETVSFAMMFYRKDVLATLGLDVPRTWDDLLTCVPVFQASNMEIGLTRNYNMFLYQAGGDRWEYAGREYDGTRYANLMSDRTFATYFDYMQIAYDTNVALNSFRYMCRFFTDYGFSVAFDGSNRFRTGEMPIVIGDAVGLYNTLTVFATEIRGLWMFANVPGTERSDGTFNNDEMAGVSAVVMMNGVEDADSSWKFMKWLVSAEVQSSYGNNMVSLIGPSAKYATANMNALLKMSWTAEEYTNLYTQFQHLSTTPNYPGTYIFDRYLNFAFLNTYEKGADPVEQLQGYVKTINKEISRKRTEFDLPIQDDGQPIDDVIDTWLVYLRGLSDEELKTEWAFSQSVIDQIRATN